MRVWIVVALAWVCTGGVASVYAEERKYLLLNEDPVSPLRNIDSAAGECLLRISEDHEVALTMANGKVARGWLRRGTPVVVNKDGVAWWVYNCGNAIVWPLGWKPEGPTECFSGRESTSCAPEKIVPTPTPAATPRKSAIKRETKVVPQRTPAPRATPSPTSTPQKEEVRVARQDEQPLSPSPRMVTEEKGVPEKTDVVPAGNTQVTNQSVSLSVEVKEGRPQYLPKEPLQKPQKKEATKRRTRWVVGGIILGVVAVGAAAALSEGDGRRGGGGGGGGEEGGPAPEPPNG